MFALAMQLFITDMPVWKTTRTGTSHGDRILVNKFCNYQSPPGVADFVSANKLIDPYLSSHTFYIGV